jgi:hypothetical protein
MCLDGRLPSSLEHSPQAEDVFPGGVPDFSPRFTKPKRGPSLPGVISKAERGPGGPYPLSPFPKGCPPVSESRPTSPLR